MMRIKAVPQRPYSPDLAPCDFWSFSKLRGCRYETIEEMKEAVTNVIDTLTQESPMWSSRSCSNGTSALQPEEITSEGNKTFMCVLSIKVPIRKKVWKLIVCTSYILYRGKEAIRSETELIIH